MKKVIKKVFNCYAVCRSLFLGSQFDVNVREFAVQQQSHIGLMHEPGHVVASGKGLKGGRVGDRAWFVVELHGADGHCETFVTGTSDSKIDDQ